MRIRRLIAALGLVAALGGAGAIAPAPAQAAVRSPATYCLYTAGDGTGRYWIRMGESENSTNWGYLYSNTGGLITSFAPGTPTYYNGVRHAVWSNMSQYPNIYYSYRPDGSWTAIGPFQYIGLCKFPLN